ncbi:MAG: enoyl-CoA hydratase/isomerase family protein [Pseudomonadota bacterium]
MSGKVDLTIDAGVAEIVLNQPDKLNAMTRSMWIAFSEAWERIGADDNVRCVLLRGEGRGFCPGNDIGEFESERSNEAKARALSDIMNRGRTAMLACPHPIVARIQGPCIGGGLEIAAMADIRIASDKATFGAPLNKIGLSMAYEEMLPIWKLCGRTQMYEFLVEGRIIDAKAAYLRGLVNRVVAPDALIAETDETISTIIDGPPLVHRWHKKFLNRLEDPAPLTKADHDDHYLAFETEDYERGYKAFLSKTKPDFVGR